MTLDELYGELLEMTPIEKCGKVAFPAFLQEKLQIYRNILDSVDEEQRLEKWGQLIKNVDDLMGVINKTVQLVYEGQHGKAFDVFSETVSEFGYLSFLIKTNSSFYRLRTFDDKREANHKELFHIPFSKRGKVATQRFSMPGVPCLYLSESIYGCWEEMGRPPFDTCMVSRLENTKDFQVADLRFPKKEHWMQTNPYRQNYIFNQLSKFPLILSCMVRVNDEKATFKPEYIIPQLLLETYSWLGHNCLKNKDYFYGIVYTSVQKNKDFDFPDRIFDNFAIPVISQKGEYCEHLCELFHITEPTCEEYERLKKPFEPLGAIDNSLTKEEYNYVTSVFGRLENRLLDSNRFPLQTITSNG